MKAILRQASNHKLLAILLLGILIMGGVCCLSFSHSQTARASDLSPPLPGADFMRWRLIEQRRVSDGGTTAAYELLLPGGGRKVENLEVYYLVKPWERLGRGRRVFGPVEIYTHELSGDPSHPSLTLYYGGSARIEIMAGALIGGQFHTARTLLSVYGNADHHDPKARRVAAPPVWPGINLPRAGFYRALTGEPIYFNLNQAKALVRAFEQSREVTAELADLGGGAYRYTPPLDPVLSAPGYSVKRDVVFMADLGDSGGVLSYYLPVSRSYYGHQYLAPGLLVVGLAALASLGVVKLAGRRFKWR